MGSAVQEAVGYVVCVWEGGVVGCFVVLVLFCGIYELGVLLWRRVRG